MKYVYLWIFHTEGNGIDYSVFTTRVSVEAGTRDIVDFTVLQDNLAQEFNETFNLTLVPARRTASNVFGDTIEVVIIDTDGMSYLGYDMWPGNTLPNFVL